MRIPLPELSEDCAALVVRGYTMGAIRDGWVVIIRLMKSKPSADLHDKLCVVRTIGGRVLLRFVRVGRRAERWDLQTVNGEQLLDVELAWAEPVLCIIPHELTPPEIKFLGELPDGEMTT